MALLSDDEVRDRLGQLDGWERLDRYVVSRPRRHGFGDSKELILLDGTGSLELNRRLFGEDMEEHRTAVARQGLTIQVTAPSNRRLSSSDE